MTLSYFEYRPVGDDLDALHGAPNKGDTEVIWTCFRGLGIPPEISPTMNSLRGIVLNDGMNPVLRHIEVESRSGGSGYVHEPLVHSSNTSVDSSSVSDAIGAPFQAGFSLANQGIVELGKAVQGNPSTLPSCRFTISKRGLQRLTGSPGARTTTNTER